MLSPSTTIRTQQTDSFVKEADDHPKDNLPSTSTGSRLSTVAVCPEGRRPWFHGEMGKAEAEHLLAQGPTQQYLVRRCDSTRYYLSYLVADGRVVHYPIRQLGNHFYFMGEGFCSLSDLVFRFESTVDFAEPAKLQYFPTPLSDDPCEMYVCITAAEGNAESDELSAECGDVISFVEASDEGWFWAVNEKTKRLGFVPMECVEPVITNDVDPRASPFFHRTPLVQEEIVKHLTIAGSGAFLIRESRQGPGCFALMVRTNEERIEKFLVRESSDDNGGFVLSGRRFKTLSHIIERYCHHPISHGQRLTHAVFPETSESIDHCALFAGARRSSLAPSSIGGLSHTQSTRSLCDLADHPATNSHVISSISAQRKSREDKAWKQCVMTLYDDPQVGCYMRIADPDTGKTRYSFELAFCQLWNIDESVMGRDGCLFVAPLSDSDGQGTFISVRPLPELIRWMQMLRPRILGLAPGSLPAIVGLHIEAPRLTQLGLLDLRIDKYRSEALKPDSFYSAYCAINQVKVCATQSVCPSSLKTGSVVLDSSFLVPFIPTGEATLQLSLLSNHSSGKKVRPRAFGLSPLLALLQSNEVQSAQPEQGFCFRVARHRIPVLSRDSYMVLVNYMCEDGGVSLLEWASDGMSVQQRLTLCAAVAAFFINDTHTLIDFLQKVVGRVVEGSSGESLMRQDSFGTSLLTQTLRIAARSQLEDGLEKLQLANMKLPQGSDVDAVVQCLSDLVTPHTLTMKVLCVVSRLAEKKFTQEPHLVRRALSAVFVLRFANPLLLGVLSGNPLGQQLARGVQGAANMAAAARQDDSSHAAHIFKDLFESIRNHAHKEVHIDHKSDLSSSGTEWLAIICFLLQQQFTVDGGRSGAPELPAEIQRILEAHET